MKDNGAGQFNFNDLLTAKVERDIGMQQAADNAERSSAGWNDVAFSFLVKFAENNAQFISEDVSDATKGTDFPQPPTDRAWGHAYKRAAKQKIIKQVGIGRSRRRHASICPLWGSLIFKGVQ